MSGGHYPYPKYVWAPTGGWWFTPKNYKTNGVIFASLLVASAFVSYQVTKNVQHDPQFEHSEETIKRWNDAVKNKK